MGFDPPRPAWRFEGFVLDTANGRLLDASGAEVTLRPKTYALLCFLLENSGRLVDRDSILTAVWPGVFVTDDSVTQCVGEIRRALGEAGPRLLRTMPRRGYLFEAAERIDGALGGAPGPDAAPAGPVVADCPALTAPTPPAPDGHRAEAGPTGSGDPADGTGRAAFAAARLPPPAARRWPALAAAAVLAALPVIWLAWPSGSPQRLAVAGPSPAAVPPARAEAERWLREGRRVFYREGDSRTNWLESRVLFERAIEADPTYAPPYAEAVYTYTNVVLREMSPDPAADLATAERLADRAAALEPDAFQTHIARAAVMRGQGRWEEALRSYQRAVALNASQSPARANSGLMLILLGRAEEARPSVETALTLAGPQHRRAFEGLWLGYLGLMDLYLGQGDHGVSAFRASLDHGASEPLEVRQLHLAAALAMNGEIAAARVLADAARSRRPDLTIPWFRQRALSSNPVYLEQRRRLYLGLANAGVPDEPQDGPRAEVGEMAGNGTAVP